MNQPKNIRLYNSMTRKIEDLAPLSPGHIKLYCCGPTVYDYQHIGNLRTYLFEDFLARMLRYAGYKVTHVMNVTDVGHLVSDADEGEDKMAVAMKREKRSSADIAEHYTDIFLEHCEALHIHKPDIICKATEHVEEMIKLIKRIESNGYTYVAGGNVYFDISQFSKYGELADLKLDNLQAGARIEVDPNKRNPYDFVLWFTKSKFENQELQWDSPWGRGYPGWHIECSAMAIKYLGDQFDIHCGGIDHIPVHHTNEIAQSEAATGKPWVNLWMHGEFLVLNKEKMSKSKGGFLTLDTVPEKGFEPLTYRMLCLGAHYRRQLAWSWDAVESAQNGLNKIKSAVLNLKSQVEPEQITHGQELESEHIRNFEDALFEDLNLPKALAVVWNVLSDGSITVADKLSQLYRFDQVLGLGIEDWQPESLDAPDEVKELLNARQEARTSQNWEESDRLRDQIGELGFSVLDSSDGQTLKRK